MAYLSFQSFFGAFLSWSLSGAVSLTGLIARLQQLRGLNVRKAVSTELNSRGSLPLFFFPFLALSPLPVVLPAPTFFCHLICCPTLFLLPHNRQHTWDLWPPCSHIPVLLRLSLFGALSLQTLSQGPPRPLRELPGVRWASTMSHCHLRHQTSGSTTHTRTAVIFKTFPTEKHFEVRTDTKHLDKPAPNTLLFFFLSPFGEEQKLPS